MGFVCDDRARSLLAFRQGESDLVYRDGKWFLYATVNYIEPPTETPGDWLGVDLGIVNLATDSEGNLRRRHARKRATWQAKGPRAAKGLLRKRRHKEQRFATHVNHDISKRLHPEGTRQAQDTQRGIALEDLPGLRARITVRKAQRRDQHSWAFGQMRQFITYKAQRAQVQRNLCLGESSAIYRGGCLP